MKRTAAFYNKRATCQGVALYCDYIVDWVFSQVLHKIKLLSHHFFIVEFVYQFLNRLQSVADDEKAHNVCKSAYTDTLAKHHPFLIRKGAQVAMFAIPTRGELLKRVCHTENTSRAVEKLPEMLQYMYSVYNRTDQLYTLNDLHNLP